MKRAVFVVLAASLLGGAVGCDKLKSLAGNTLGSDFEGEITMGITRKSAGAAPGPSTFIIGIKKPKYRIDAASGALPIDNPLLSGGAAVLLDPPQKKGYALVPAMKRAVVLDFDKLRAARSTGSAKAGSAPVKKSAPPPAVEKTGKTDTVAGHTCEVWKVTSQTQKAEVCAAQGITWIDLSDLGWASPEITVAAVATGMNAFPLRIVTYGANGAEDARLEATKIEKKKLDDAHFAVPADYQVFDPSTLLQNIPVLGLPKP